MLTLSDRARHIAQRARAEKFIETLSPRQRIRLLFGDPLELAANNPLWYDAAVNAVAGLLNGGFLSIYTGAQPAIDVALTGTLLAKLTFGSPAFGGSSGGTATANAITSAAAVASGTAGYFALLESDGATVVATGTVGTSGTDLVLNSTSISSGANVSCSSFTITG